jgi:hypothetical protein
MENPTSSSVNNPMNLLSAVGLGDLNTTLKISNQNFSQFLQLLQAIFPRTFGTFTMPAAATITVTQPAVSANSLVVPLPTNAAAAQLMGGTKHLYQSAVVAGTNFTFSTGSGVAATGGETFAYFILTPV